MYYFFKFLSSVFPVKSVYAHCDIPCGIYTAEPAQTAARTVVKMVEKLYEQVPPADNAGRQEWLEFENTLARCIMVKEEHAKKCKEEILILWTDYFKPEHLEMFPDLHEKVWNITKLCSKNKQQVNMEFAQQLKKEVDEFAEIFHRVEEARKSK
ncbi:MAG: superoxide dismutase, Ni [Candidatus Wildermuthbacteria bacterium]|nr:superoxide dismutase, Ni [Candidatus Wildermuthbacteria bacterium]